MYIYYNFVNDTSIAEENKKQMAKLLAQREYALSTYHLSAVASTLPRSLSAYVPVLRQIA